MALQINADSLLGNAQVVWIVLITIPASYAGIRLE